MNFSLSKNSGIIKLYRKFSFFIKKNKPAISLYVWRKYFCWYPVVVKTARYRSLPFYNVVWLSYVYRRGPFSEQNGDVFEYSLSAMPLKDMNNIVQVCRPGRREEIIDSLICSKEKLLEGKEKEEKERSIINSRIKSYIKQTEIENQREKKRYEERRTAPLGFEENSGIAPE